MSEDSIPLSVQLAYGASRAFRSIVPRSEDRIPLTWNNAVYPLACYAPFIFLAYLARRPGTYVVRLLLLPSVVTCVLVSAYGFTWTAPQLNVYNWGQGLLAAVVIAKSIEYAFTEEGMLKIGESRPGVLKGKGKQHSASMSTNGSANNRYDDDHNQVYTPYSASPQSRTSTPSWLSLPTWFTDAFELAHTMRGLQFKFGLGTPIPPYTRSLTNRTQFLLKTLHSFLLNYLVLDILESLVKLLPGTVGTPEGGSIFYPSLPPLQRYLVSTLIHIGTGTCILQGFNMVYDLITLLAVGVFHSSPLRWPPVMDNPWTKATSMHTFWSRSWHQQLRRTFYIYGGYPGWVLTGGSEMGLVAGTFVASGLFHECAMYAMRDHQWDWAPVVFFSGQGVVLVLERAWRKVTGRRVGGWVGRLWVYFIMFVCAQPMVDSWHRRGLGGGMVIPPLLSPTRQVLVPLAQRWMDKV